MIYAVFTSPPQIPIVFLFLLPSYKYHRFGSTLKLLQHTSIHIMSSQSIPEPQNVQVAGFIAKTFEILKNQEFGKIIYWAPSGTQFIIKDANRFQQVVLPRYFRHSKMNSFIRQLNMYGFHKSRTDHVKSVFSHPLFQKGREDLLITIKRKIKGRNQQDGQKILHSSAPINILKKDQHTPKKDYAQTREEITSAKEIGTIGRQLRSAKKFSFGEQNKMNTFNLLFSSREKLPSRMNLNTSLRRVSSRQIPHLLDEQSEQLSIQQKIQRNDQAFSMKLINPSCFFASMRK